MIKKIKYFKLFFNLTNKHFNDIIFSMNKDPQALLLSIYQQSQEAQVIQMPGRGRYEELELFRKHVEITTHLPYTALKACVLRYRLIFLGLGVLFLILAAAVSLTTHSLPLIWTTGAFFTVRNLLTGVCVLFGIGAFGITATMSCEGEAAKRIGKRAQRGLVKAVSKKHVEMGLQGNFWRWNCKKTASLTQAYKEALEKLRDQQDELSHLFDRIRTAGFLNARSREHLYNQALLEASEKAKALVQKFKRKI